MPTLLRISNFVEKIQYQLDSLAGYYDQENMRDRNAIAEIKAIYKDCRSMISKVKVELAERNLKRKREDCKYWQNIIINEKIKLNRHDEDSDDTLVLEPCQPSTPESDSSLPVTPRTQRQYHHPELQARTMSTHIHHSTPINCQESCFKPRSRQSMPFTLLSNFPELLHPQKKTKISNDAQVINLTVQKHTSVPRKTLGTDLENCSLSIIDEHEENTVIEQQVRKENGADLNELVPAKPVSEEKNLKICHTQKEFISTKKTEPSYEKPTRPLQQKSCNLLKEVKASVSGYPEALQSVEGTGQVEDLLQDVLQLLVPATYSSRDPRFSVSSNKITNLYNYYKLFLERSLAATKYNAANNTSQPTLNVNTVPTKRGMRQKTAIAK